MLAAFRLSRKKRSLWPNGNTRHDDVERELHKTHRLACVHVETNPTRSRTSRLYTCKRRTQTIGRPNRSKVCRRPARILRVGRAALLAFLAQRTVTRRATGCETSRGKTSRSLGRATGKANRRSLNGRRRLTAAKRRWDTFGRRQLIRKALGRVCRWKLPKIDLAAQEAAPGFAAASGAAAKESKS